MPVRMRLLVAEEVVLDRHAALEQAPSAGRAPRRSGPCGRARSARTSPPVASTMSSSRCWASTVAGRCRPGGSTASRRSDAAPAAAARSTFSSSVRRAFAADLADVAGANARVADTVLDLPDHQVGERVLATAPRPPAAGTAPTYQPVPIVTWTPVFSEMRRSAERVSSDADRRRVDERAAAGSRCTAKPRRPPSPRRRAAGRRRSSAG